MSFLTSFLTVVFEYSGFRQHQVPTSEVIKTGISFCVGLNTAVHRSGLLNIEFVMVLRDMPKVTFVLAVLLIPTYTPINAFSEGAFQMNLVQLILLS